MRKIHITGYIELLVDQEIDVSEKEYQEFLYPLEEDILDLTLEGESFILAKIDHENVEAVYFIPTLVEPC